MEVRRYGEYTTLETRREANENVDRAKRYKEILECLGNNKMTAKEVAVEDGVIALEFRPFEIKTIRLVK